METGQSQTPCVETGQSRASCFEDSVESEYANRIGTHAVETMQIKLGALKTEQSQTLRIGDSRESDSKTVAELDSMCWR